MTSISLGLLARTAAAAAAVSLVGCAASSYDIEVSLADSLAGASVVPTMELDVVGSTSIDAEVLRRSDVGTYFDPSGSLRSSVTKRTLTFSNRSRDAQLIPSSAEIWKQWNDAGVTSLFFIVNLPPVGGESDQRKLEVPLSGVSGPITVEIEREGLTRPQPD